MMDKLYYISYSFFDGADDEVDDLLSYGYIVFKVKSVKEAFDCLYSEMELQDKIMAAIYSVTIE